MAQRFLALDAEEPEQDSQSTMQELYQVVKALDFVIRSAHGIVSARQILAQVRHLTNELDKVLQAATICL